jgi:hypothetical protein
MLGKLRHQIVSDFVTTRSNARTNCRNEVARLAAESSLERSDGCHRRTGGCTLPPGMHRGDSPSTAIAKKNRDTVGGSDRERNRPIACDGDVGFGPVVVAISSSLEHTDVVHLSHPHESRVIDL